MAASPVVLPPPPHPPAQPDPAAPTYYNFVGLDGLGTVPGATEWFPGGGTGPEQYPAEPTATYLTSSSPNPAGFVDSWQAPGFPVPTVEPLQPISFSPGFPPRHPARPLHTCPRAGRRLERAAEPRRHPQRQPPTGGGAQVEWEAKTRRV